LTGLRRGLIGNTTTSRQQLSNENKEQKAEEGQQVR
jgi:hypothetical protein